jgi:hypothetical protein
MNNIPIQNIWFDDAATLAMGEAFDNACKSLQNLGSAVPAIIANLIIAAAKNGERDPGRLYEQVLKAYGIDASMLVVSVGRDPPSQPTLWSRTQRDLKRAQLAPVAGLSLSFAGAYSNCRPLDI